MHILKDLCYMLEDHIEPVIKKGDISPAEMDTVYKAVKTMYYIKVIEAMNETGYSERRMSYDSGNSYGYYNGRGRDSMGRYASRDGYSGHENREEMRAHLQMAIDSAPSEAEKAVLRDYMNKL